MRSTAAAHTRVGRIHAPRILKHFSTTSQDVTGPPVLTPLSLIGIPISLPRCMETRPAIRHRNLLGEGESYGRQQRRRRDRTSSAPLIRTPTYQPVQEVRAHTAVRTNTPPNEPPSETTH